MKSYENSSHKLSSCNQYNLAKPTLVYILAASHSGSTLTTLLIASHKDFCTIGELKASNLGDPDKYRCACLKFIKSCEFWDQMHRGMQQKGFDFQIWNANTNFSETQNRYAKKLLAPLVRNSSMEWIRDTFLSLSPSWRKELYDKKERNVALIKTLREISGKSFIVDSSKIGIRLKYLIQLKDINVKVVRVIRDGRGVALTYMNPFEFADAKNKELRGGGLGSNRDKDKLSMRDAANEWRRSNEEAEELLKLLPKEDWIQIRYEDICRNPVNVLNSVYSFLEVAKISKLPDFRLANQHVIGNGMRLDSTKTIQLDERWREVLSKDQLSEFNHIAGDFNRKYGYE
jgi:hypothetical protein